MKVYQEFVGQVTSHIPDKDWIMVRYFDPHIYPFLRIFLLCGEEVRAIIAAYAAWPATSPSRLVQGLDDVN
jgi:hypothetical protein